MRNIASSAPGTAESGRKKSLKERAVSELEKYAVIAAYVWFLFALFNMHKQLVQGHAISIWEQDFAIVNALIFGKVILFGQALEVRASGYPFRPHFLQSSISRNCFSSEWKNRFQRARLPRMRAASWKAKNGIRAAKKIPA